jgi:hypothetical protein
MNRVGRVALTGDCVSTPLVGVRAELPLGCRPVPMSSFHGLPRLVMTSVLVVPRGELQPSLSESYLRSKTQIGSSPPSVEVEQSAEKESYVNFSHSTLLILIMLAVVAAVYHIRLKLFTFSAYPIYLSLVVPSSFYEWLHS